MASSIPFYFGGSSVLTRILPLLRSSSRYSPRPFANTRSDPTISSTFPYSTFSALAQILPFPSTHPNPSPVLSWIPHFRHSLEFYPFPILTRTLLRNSPGFQNFGTCPDFHFFGTRPDSTFPVFSQISTFFAFSRILAFFGTRSDSALFRHSLGFCPFSALARIYTFSELAQILPFPELARILPFPTLAWILPFFGTHPNSTFPTLARILPFPVLARIPLFRNFPGFYLFRCLPGPFSGNCPEPSLVLTRISLSFPALCLNHSSFQASCLSFSKSFSRGNSIPLTFGTG